MSESVNEEVSEESLRNTLRQLKNERSYLYYLFLQSNQNHEKGPDVESSADIQELQERMKELSSQHNFLVKELSLLIDENEEVSQTFQDIIKERETLEADMKHATSELDSCKSVIDFLLLEQEELKKEVATKSALLSTYEALFNQENMFHYSPSYIKKYSRKFSLC